MLTIEAIKVQVQSFGQQEELGVVEGELASVQELHFSFQRAASRLVEMSSEEYLKAWSEKYGENS
ncbi:cell division protein ZapE [archaeon]|nr:MAG: cell division protein ZapE [archaeon]